MHNHPYTYHTESAQGPRGTHAASHSNINRKGLKGGAKKQQQQTQSVPTVGSVQTVQ